MKSGKKWFLRKLDQHDLPILLIIEKQSAEDQSNDINGGVIPCSAHKLASRIKDSKRYRCMGVLHGCQIVGFIIVNQTSFHIENLVVQRVMRRKGIGTALIQEAKELLAFQRDRLVMFVRETNLRGLRFLRPLNPTDKSNGFGATGLIKDYFKRPPPLIQAQKWCAELEPAEDAIVMECANHELPSLTSAQKMIRLS